jgi:hypothetical protein
MIFGTTLEPIVPNAIYRKRPRQLNQIPIAMVFDTLEPIVPNAIYRMSNNQMSPVARFLTYEHVDRYNYNKTQITLILNWK